MPSGIGRGCYCDGIDICPDFPRRIVQDLPDLAYNKISITAVVGRFRLGAHRKPDQRRIRRPQDGRAQTRRGIVQQQDHICRTPCRLQPQGRPHGPVALIRQEQKAQSLRDGQCQQQHGQQLTPQGLRKQPAQKGEAPVHGSALTSAARL